jgi:hypothetical protein
MNSGRILILGMFVSFLQTLWIIIEIKRNGT